VLGDKKGPSLFLPTSCHKKDDLKFQMMIVIGELSDHAQFQGGFK
jgi:hypothetical protein